MGKGRKCKTTWRRVPWEIDEHSDNSEEFETSTTTNNSTRLHQKSGPYANRNGYSSTYGRYNSSTYSSQSTPTRRYQYENGTKSTRSSSTASENKITFNEDEYTRINTPRQDVLFKKGYLNKPKVYQTQTSTGNSTTSTGNSTGNGTPDHQSADLDLESQFHFPNGYIDQNGIYFLNSYEPLPVMFSYQPTYYHEFSDVKSKRYSTGSLTESTSPANEETSQEETTTATTTPSNASAEFNNHHNGYINHVVYNNHHHQEYYCNGTNQPKESTEKSQPRTVKKKKRRRTTSHEASASTSTNSEDEDESADEVFNNAQDKEDEEEEEDEEDKVEDKTQDAQKLLMDSLVVVAANESASSAAVLPDDENTEKSDAAVPKSDLKPDAEEFVPRSFYSHQQQQQQQQQETIPMDPMQFIKIPPNFVPVPMMGPSGEYPAFIPAPTGIFVPHQNYFVPANMTPYPRNEEAIEEINKQQGELEEQEEEEEEEKKPVEVPKAIAVSPPKQIDIAKIVSKLEEAAKEQDEEEAKPNGSKPKRQNYRRFRSLNEKPRRFKPRQATAEAKSSNALRSESFEPRLIQKTAAQPTKPAESRHPKTLFELKSAPRSGEARTLAKNYSETLKKREVKEERDKVTPKPKPQLVKVSASPVKEPRPVKLPNEWISVSSKKKRKNRNVEEFEDFDEIVDKEKDEFQCYDVNLLRDVVVVDSVKEVEQITERVQEVTIQEKELVQVEQIAEEIKATIEEEEEEEKPKPKKTKKKTITKRVMITDVDMSQDYVEPEQAKVTVPEPEEKLVKEEEETRKSPEKKPKSKKKKKKQSVETAPSVVVDKAPVPDQEKTNVEISQELDMLIKKRMFNSFDSSGMGEMKDDFFKSIMSHISREPSVEKNVLKTPDFSRMFTNALLKPKPPPTILEPSSSTSTNGHFLAEDTPTSGGVTEETEPTRESIQNEAKGDKLYPITQAVKEWMTKTRENTPEVEILKSPSTINKEFGAATDDGQETDEVTVWSKESSIDLLECWEDEIETKVEPIEQAEDVLEVYESKFGQNDDYKRIQAEIEAKQQQQSFNFPKHGNLPYRAICCSIM